MTGFIAWLGIAISHYRFRRGYVIQGYDVNDLPYRSGFFPLGPTLSDAGGITIKVKIIANHQAHPGHPYAMTFRARDDYFTVYEET
ncbi:hypothetical protein MJM59_30530, partial [Salmonella enterica subsp. enterica serovar Montevideo]|nr:hypothetical protein [Salmonella enterica subsp. enterica serovar Montevideo]